VYKYTIIRYMMYGLLGFILGRAGVDHHQWWWFFIILLLVFIIEQMGVSEYVRTRK